MSESIAEQVQELKDSVERQHRPLLGALRGLETMLEASPPAQGDLERRLNALADLFEAHAKEEESGDLYRLAPATIGDANQELEELRTQHSPIVETIRQLAIDTRSAETVRPSTDLSVQIRTIIADIRQHEARESALIHKLA